MPDGNLDTVFRGKKTAADAGRQTGIARVHRRVPSAVIALLIVLVFAAWMASGLLAPDAEVPPPPSAAIGPPAVTVEVRPSRSRDVTRFLVVRGDVAPARDIPLRAETAGTVANLPVRKGTRVEAGQAIVRLAGRDRDARLERAQAELSRAAEDHRAVERLADRGYATTTRLRQAFAELQAARAAVEEIAEEIADTTIRAPFAGVLETLDVEPGEYVPVGTEVARIVDVDPLIVEVRVPQRNIRNVRLDTRTAVHFATGGRDEGVVRYIAANADRSTHTFLVEIEVDNSEARLPAGISAEAHIPLGQVAAHFVSPAFLSLDDQGVLGVKTVDENDRVEFVPVEIVRAENAGVWLAGPPDEARIITTGQGFVSPGERVRIVEGDAIEPPARPDSALPVSEEPVRPVPPLVDSARGREVRATTSAIPGATPPRDALAENAEGQIDDPELVARVQERLNALGYEAGPADGRIGPRTRTAISAFQADQGLPMTGMPTPGLLERLADALTGL